MKVIDAMRVRAGAGDDITATSLNPASPFRKLTLTLSRRGEKKKQCGRCAPEETARLTVLRAEFPNSKNRELLLRRRKIVGDLMKCRYLIRDG